MPLRYISAVAVDLKVVVYLTTVPHWLLVVLSVAETVPVVA